jgi:hypothetical protein
MTGGHTPEQVTRFERELAQDRELVERILASFPAVPEPKLVIIKTDRTSVDAAIARALVLAMNGIESRIEFTNVEHTD